MDEVLQRIVATLLCTTLFCMASVKSAGAMQQSGYKGGRFLSWLSAKENMLFNRLCVLALCLALTCGISALCFSFLGVKAALLVSAVPFIGLMLCYLTADRKYALKVQVQWTSRLKRLFVLYAFLVACVTYILIAVLGFLSKVNGSQTYALIAYVPFALSVILLPFLLALAAVMIAPFENARNAKFVKRAGQVLDETKIIRVAVVGSYGKTSVKNILKTILEEKFSVVATPQSYNTPMGIAKTVLSPAFADKQVLIAEMGARGAGDVQELVDLVKPDFAVFTGVCEQHINTFGSVENAFYEKSAVVRGEAFCVCGESLLERMQAAFEEEFLQESVVFAGLKNVENLQLLPTRTQFTLVLGEERVDVDTALLGEHAAENIALAAVLAYEALGVSAQEIAQGVAKLQPIPHRLQLLESGGAYILDDAYNSNIVGAKQALDALARFEKGRCVVTPGLVECGMLEERLNGELGAYIAKTQPQKVILVGQTLVCAVKRGYENAGGDKDALVCVKTLEDAKPHVAEFLGEGDCVLFLNDLPDVY